MYIYIYIGTLSARSIVVAPWAPPADRLDAVKRFQENIMLKWLKSDLNIT